MTSATSSTSMMRVHSSPVHMKRHSVPPRRHTSRERDRADIPISKLAIEVYTMCENNRESVEKMGEQMDKFLSVLEDADQRIKDLTARVRTLENLIGGNMVREGYN